MQEEKEEKDSLKHLLKSLRTELQIEANRQKQQAIELAKVKNQLEVGNNWNKETLIRVSKMGAEATVQRQSHAAELAKLNNELQASRYDNQGFQY